MDENLNRILNRIWRRKVPFFVVFFVAVLITLAFLTVIDFVPEPVTEEPAGDVPEPATTVIDQEPVETAPIDPYPTKIIFDSLDREVTVLNPASRTVADLDEALLGGAVRHPDSADFTEPGNIFILGHSSYLPNVFNKNFQAFNGIQELEEGDVIRLQSDTAEYTYVVERVYMAQASEVFVPFTPGEAKLTLTTCNSFGSKEDRFVVEAVYVGENLQRASQ